MDVELELSTGESKEKRDVVAKLYVLNISSAPVDQDEPGVRHKRVALADNSGAYYTLKNQWTCIGSVAPVTVLL
jgi:hypothetical protein